MSKREIAIEREITPSHLRCGSGTCPAVYQLSDGNLLIVGKSISSDLDAAMGHRVGSDEHAVIISPEYLSDVSVPWFTKIGRSFRKLTKFMKVCKLGH
jgi:hypothetical protein